MLYTFRFSLISALNIGTFYNKKNIKTIILSTGKLKLLIKLRALLASMSTCSFPNTLQWLGTQHRPISRELCLKIISILLIMGWSDILLKSSNWYPVRKLCSKYIPCHKCEMAQNIYPVINLRWLKLTKLIPCDKTLPKIFTLS